MTAGVCKDMTRVSHGQFSDNGFVLVVVEVNYSPTRISGGGVFLEKVSRSYK